MAYIDEQSYEEMINALSNFKKQIETQCGIMESAGKDCMDNMEADEYVTESNTKLKDCVLKIRENYDTIDRIIRALEEELEKVRKLAAKREQND